MRIVLGGTFSPLHKGHKALFERAFELSNGDVIIIGLTSDDMANAQRERKVMPYTNRKDKLESYLESMTQRFPQSRFEIREILEVYNKSITQERDADAFVVSEGRVNIAKETNKQREKHNKTPLEIISIPYVLAQDGQPIKATRIAAGEIDEEGKLLGKVTVAVGTENDVKLRAVQNIFGRIFSELDVKKVEVSSGVRPQPWDAETITGAQHRAKEAIIGVSGAHYGVGIEAGLFRNEELDRDFDVQYCVIRDAGGRETIGHGSGFYYPTQVIDGVKLGKSVGEVMSILTGTQNIGRKQGAIGHLSQGLLSREALTEQAVLMALVPRLTDLYE